MKSRAVLFVFLSVLIATSSLLPYFSFFVKKIEIAQKARVALLEITDSKTFQILLFTQEEFERLDFELFNSNEFKWQGMMYDIIKIEQVGNSVKVICFEDKAESQAIKTLLTKLKSSIKLMDDAANEQQSGVSWYFSGSSVFSVQLVKLAVDKVIPYYCEMVPTGVYFRDKKPPQVWLS